ncbi:unnamed protein product [Symbiodinium sp. CCMP2592]|nr:unnamed protein product [Symbiodinium sp. CCMP2592]
MATRTSRQLVPYVPADVVIHTQANQSLTHLERGVKHLGALVRLMRQLIPFHEAVDVSLWPSPFDVSVSKRKWEQWCRSVRVPTRLLKEDGIENNRPALSRRGGVGHLTHESRGTGTGGELLISDLDDTVPDDHDTASTAVLRPCTELASHNSCDLDTHLQFEVTTLIHQYSEDFDPLLALSKMKNGTRWPRSEYLDAEMNFSSIAGMLKGLDFRYQADLVALLQEDKPDVDEICRLFCISRSELKDLDKVIEQFVLHDNEIILLWETKKNCASNSGTWMHAMLEHLFNGYQIMAGKMQGELNAAVRIVSQMENAVVYRTEWCIYAPEEDVAGSIDMVLKDVNNDVLYLLDWKRSEKLEEKYNSYGKTMHAPLQGINDSQGHHYRLQLNIYKWILEKYYHVKVAGMKVVCIHPRYLPDGFVDDEPAPQPQREGLVVPETETGQPSLTQPFQILPNTQASNGYRVEEDLEAMFEDMFEDEADAARMAAKKRRLLPGAAEHSDRFRSTFQRSHDILRTTLDVLVADRSVQPNTILHSTKKSLQELRMDFPNVSDQIRRLVLVAAHLTEGKISDKPMLADSAALLWMVEGDRHLRVHKGFLYIYDGDGCFQPFGGIPPEAVLHRVHDFFVYLEGILRRMKPENSRRAASVARAIVSDLQSFETEDDFLQACRDAVNRRSTTAAYPSRLDAADDEVANQAQAEAASDNTWTIDAAEKSWKLSWHIRTELMQTRMISLLVEWCETEDQRSSSVTYDDVCFVYDSPGSDSPIDVVKKSPANNCYVRIPHPLLDPVMENNLERLEKFYQQTFWCNLDVFKCFQAATAIAKRGYNVDRCFIGISPGGVGQSLYSLHLSEMYKQNHTFFDPNIWHLDEELRKQVETFARCFIMTGQEAPETSKKLHIDLYKKTISADGIMGRKPYGYTTRMFHTVGWTRLEVNRMMQFAGVKSSGFNSMFRRAFVWKSKARFIHKKFLAKYIDHEKDGIFEADPSLNKFLSTSQASIAGLRLQWAFERDYSKDDCYQLIENYCNGGDGFLTEDVMRNACGLPVRQRHQQVEEGLGNLLDGDADSNAEREDRDISWKNLRSSVIQHMLDKDLEVMTFYEFKKMPCKAGEHPNLSKQAMWDEMPKQEVVRTGIAKPKTGKERPGAIIPSFIFKKKFHEVCPQTEAGQVRMQFQEEHDLGRLRSYAYRCGGRSINDDNMKMYYTAMLPASKRGRRSLEQDELTTKYQKLIQKLEDHSEHVTSLLSSQKRRILAKTSVNEDGNAAVSSSSMSATSVEYKYSDKQNYSIHGRRYGPKGSAQSTSRRLQKYLVDGHTVDLDIHNCCLTLIHQLLQKLSPDPPLADDLAEVLDEVTHRRADFVAKLNVQISEGKDIITTVFNGGAPPGKLKDNQLIKKLQKIALYVRWVACNILHDDYMSLADNKLKSFPSATIMSLMWHAVEDSILQAWSEHVLMDNPKHLSLHFDGIRVSADKVQNSEDYIRKCQAAVKDRTSFDVKIMVKTHGSLIDLIQTRGNVANNLTNVPAKLLEAGNCIPCSLWHSDPLSRTTVAAAVLDDDKAENAEAKKTRYRTYRSVATMCGLDIVSCLGLPQPHVKTFLLHYEGNGSPHCLSVRLEGDTATLIDGNVVYKIPVGAFQEACAAAVDRSTVVSHWKRDAKDKLDDKSTLLLDLVAGATSGTSDEETDMDIDKGFGKITHDDEDENTPVISDGILQSLCQEVEDVLDKLKENSLRQGGRRHCPFCLFRSFAQLRQLRTHMTNHHTEKNQYVCSGTKQIKVILSLYDHGASSQSRVEELLQSSASLLRATIQPSLESNRNSIDKKIRLILDATGPRYVNLESIGTTIKARRVKNMYYTHSFADLLLREMVLGADAGYTVSHRGSEDITTSEAFKNKMEQMLTAFSKHDEWHYISMDATLKLCMKIMGQAPYRASKQVRNDAPFGDDVAWRRLLTVRGRTGAVLLMEPLPKESSDYIVGAISDNFSEAQLVSVHYVGTDSPSEKLYTELRSVCPNLRALMLDPIHLAIVYEYGFWNKKSPGSKKLRHILRKCTAVDERVDARHWLAFYDGAMARPLNEEEVKYRDMILDFSMSERDASSILDHVQEDQPFLHRLDFIKSIAALCRRYKGEVVRKAPGPNKEIYRILWSACAPDRVEWLMNNVRVRHSMHASYLWFLPSGTASNEALHAEVNSWTRSINVMHRSTLALKLRYFKYIKMLTHYLATEHPMSHVVSANMLIGRSLHESLWSVPEWDAWCSEQHTDGVQSKARLQLAKSRQSEVKLVRNWAMKTMKKPAAKSSKPQKRRGRVTPLSVRRMHTLRTAGVKQSGSD